MEFALVPKGKGWRGGGGGKVGTIEVEFKDDFYLGAYEVTQSEWQAVMGDNPSLFSRKHVTGMRLASDSDLKRYPVENVSWEQCQEFIARLNEKAPEKGWIYRLPTIAEWEYACRGGPLTNMEDFGFDFYAGAPSNTLTSDQAKFGGKVNVTCKVGNYPPNRLGLHDMHGNVWEWCGDVSKNEPLKRHLRGGSFGNDAGNCRVIAGNSQTPSFRSGGAGLRVARVPASTP